MVILGQIGHSGAFLKWPKCMNGTDFSASNQQGDPNDGPDELEPNLSYLNHTPTIFSKFTNFLPLFLSF